MSQRNPMNDRYQTDEHRGQTRKSAATMKPKTKAASSVRIQPTVKTKQQKKADKKAARAKADRDRSAVLQPAHAGVQAPAQDLVGSFDRRHRDDGYVVVRPHLPARGGNLCGAGPGLCVHHRRPVRGLLENPQGATRLSGRDDVQKKPRRCAQQKSSRRPRSAPPSRKVEEAPAVEEAPKKRGLFGNGLPPAEEAGGRAGGGENFRQGFDEVRWGPWFLVSTWRRSPASTGRRSS